MALTGGLFLAAQASHAASPFLAGKPSRGHQKMGLPLASRKNKFFLFTSLKGVCA